MRTYLVVNKETGELESNCGVCGFNGIGNNDDPDIITIDDNHTVVEVTQDELDSMAASLVSPDDVHLVYGAKVNIEKSAKKLEMREKVEVPVEAEGIGGKEIIAVEEKPVGIIIERSPSPKRVT